MTNTSEPNNIPALSNLEALQDAFAPDGSLRHYYVQVHVDNPASKQILVRCVLPLRGGVGGVCGPRASNVPR